VDADADNVVGLDGFGEDLFEGLIDQDGIASGGRGRCGEYKEPSWGDDGGTKRVVAGIYKMNANLNLPFLRTSAVDSKSGSPECA
jgi:hypothetical protein